ncbi:hypothetical protein JD844_000645 [Phrynosoma platyrhinos]|uniref:Uncharacterized protein n=1 Tax=Phrynosoma platyrhinos TaxID=52577 RepID=A0ABQ7SQQ9_PHRPL|nr:hypothetical protein JD844_000645 [Phrynosoma platyrhinos]
MSASDRVVVVLGGAGTVGSGIVKALLEKGSDLTPKSSCTRVRQTRNCLHTDRVTPTALFLCVVHTGFQVAVISRDESRLEKLRQFLSPSACDRLHTLVGDVGSEEGAEDAKGALLKDVGTVTDVVSSLGFSWWQGGPPLSQSLKELHRVSRGAGERLLMPGTGFLTLGAAGALAFSLMVREEYPDVPCKLNEVKINMGVTTPERLGPGYVSHLEVGKAVASLVEKRAVSHTVLSAASPADLKTLALEGKI